jgi:putative NADPH-quinone reductase
MAEILPKFTEAEVLIWSFPLYGNFFPGEMKCFMDRMIPLKTMEMKEDSATGAHPLRHEMKLQKTFYISGCGFWTTEHNYNTLKTYLRHGGGNPAEFTVFTSQAPLLNEADSDPELKQLIENYLEIVKRAGKEAAVGVISAETSAALAQPILPKEIYEAAVNAEAR